jgi:RND family efflux transporter MFP subunit
MTMQPHARALLLVLGLSLGGTGCTRRPSGAPPAPPLSVSVSYPVRAHVADSADFTARTAAVDSVEVRAHVWGYLDKVNFQEGAMVRKEDVLFEIDHRTYQAAYDVAKAQVAQNVASRVLASQNNTRFRALAKENAGAVTPLDLDRYQSEEDQAVANLARARANLETAKLNLDWTKVRAPVSGRASRYVVTVGNLIQSGDQFGGTLLTTIESVDAMYAYFDVDEYTALRIWQLTREGKSDSPRDDRYPVSLGLANEDGFPHAGTINFVDNRVRANTGTIRMRGVFPNREQVLLPGLFARIRIPVGRPHNALLVSDRALDTDQGQKILYVVNHKNEVVTRPVRVGALHDGLREIADGLKPGERVVVNGLQQLRPGIAVEPKLLEMPRGSRKPGVGSQNTVAGQ